MCTFSLPSYNPAGELTREAVGKAEGERRSREEQGEGGVKGIENREQGTENDAGTDEKTDHAGY